MTNENAKSEYLLEVKDLKQYFPVRTGFMKTLPLKAVDGVSFSIKPGETLGLVGESGCGKTTVGRSILRLYTPTGGEVIFDGKDGVPGPLFLAESAHDRRGYHRRTTGCS